MDVWDGNPTQVGIFATNAQVTYPIMMQGGHTGHIPLNYNAVVDDFFVIGGDGIIKWRGKWDAAVISAAIDDAIAELSASAVPEAGPGLQLLANYPNPFNPQTVIPYELAAGAAIAVRLDIVDIQGRLVRSLVQAVQSGGARYEARWDGLDQSGQRAPSGTYLARLTAAGATRTRLVTLVK